MSNWKIIYFSERKFSPISYWVHKGRDEETTPYVQCRQFSPPFPARDPQMGFPYLIVSTLGFDFEFASILELEHCLEILGKRNLPTTLELSNKRGTGHGPNSHWLSRLPGKLKAWSKRQRIVEALLNTRLDMEHKKIRF